MRAFQSRQNQPSQQHPSSPASPTVRARSTSHQDHPILNLQRTIGNQAMLRLMQAGSQPGESASTSGEAGFLGHSFARIPVFSTPVRAIQPKLTVNTPGDAYEQEADRVAEQVMRMPGPGAFAMPAVSGGVTGVQRACSGTCADCKNDNEHAHVRMKCASTAGIESPPIVSEVLRSPGQPLDAATRAFMEPRFGHDFSGVRVHADAQAAESARAVGAKAYTVGRDIVFASGEYRPSTGEGTRLLAHELTHTAQQQGEKGGGPYAAPAMVLQRQVDDPRPLRTHSVETPTRVRVSQWLDTKGATPTTEELYWVDFEVDKEGVMRASVRTASADQAYRSSTLRLEDEFRYALQHFKNNGVQVNAFEGDWSYMTPEEMSTNLKVFQEGMAEGLTREVAAARTPSGRVAGRSGFVVTHVENVLESQAHLEGARRWRVKAVFTYVGERGSVTPAGENPAPVPQRGSRVSRALGSIAEGVLSLGLQILSEYLIARSVANFENEQIELWWHNLAPEIQAAVERRNPDIEKLLHDTNHRGTVYANIHMELVKILSILHTRSGSSPRWAVINLKFNGLDVSTESINRDDPTRTASEYGGTLWYVPFTYSVPIVESDRVP